MTKDEIAVILNQTLALSDSDRDQLSRMMGYSIRSAMTTIRGRKAVLIFMALFPDEKYEATSKIMRDILFFACCGACAQTRTGKSVKVEWYLSRIYKNDEMLAEDITLNGNILHRLSTYIKRAQRAGFRINFYALANDLQYWNHTMTWTRERWVRCITMMKEDDMNDAEEDGNDDNTEEESEDVNDTFTYTDSLN